MVLNRVINKLAERRVNRTLDKAVADLKNGEENTDDDLKCYEDEKNGIFKVTNSGFNILSTKGAFFVNWDKIGKIVSFKRFHVPPQGNRESIFDGNNSF